MQLKNSILRPFASRRQWLATVLTAPWLAGARASLLMVEGLELDPVHDTFFALSGRPRGEPVAGDDFHAALLRSVIGLRPHDKSLRAGLLGGV